MGSMAVARLLAFTSIAATLVGTAPAGEGARATVEFTRDLTPQPGGASDAVIGGQGLFVADRMDAALIRYDESGREVARYQRGGFGPGSLTQHVFVALGDDRLFAWSPRGALMRFDAGSLAFEREEETGLAGPAGRFFFVKGRFYLVGPGWTRAPDALDYFWSEADPPSARGEGRSVIWRLNQKGINARSLDLGWRPLAAEIPGGGFWILRFDSYQVARVSGAGRLEQVLSLRPPSSFRARTRELTGDELNPRQRPRYYRWLAEASVLVAPVALGAQALGIVRMELEGGGADPPRWYVDVYDSSGRPLELNQALPLSGRHLLGLRGLTSTTFEALEMSKDFLEPGSEHRWVRVRLPR